MFQPSRSYSAESGRRNNSAGRSAAARAQRRSTRASPPTAQKLFRYHRSVIASGLPFGETRRGTTLQTLEGVFGATAAQASRSPAFSVSLSFLGCSPGRTGATDSTAVVGGTV